MPTTAELAATLTAHLEHDEERVARLDREVGEIRTELRTEIRGLRGTVDALTWRVAVLAGIASAAGAGGPDAVRALLSVVGG